MSESRVGEGRGVGERLPTSVYDQMFDEHNQPTTGWRVGKMPYFPASGDVVVDREAKRRVKHIMQHRYEDIQRDAFMAEQVLLLAAKSDRKLTRAEMELVERVQAWYDSGLVDDE